MAIRKTQVSGGGEVGEIVKQKTLADKLKTKPKTYFSILIVIIAIISGFFIVWNHNKNKIKTTHSEKETYAHDFINSSDNSTANKTHLVEKYGAHYDELISKILQSNPATWNKEMLNDAYAALLYADKMGDYTHVNALLSYIEAVKARGLNIDDNSYGVNQNIRDEIKQRAKMSTQQ